MTIEELLKIVQRTNPGMTKEKLICELEKSWYSSMALMHTESVVNSCSKSEFSYEF